MLDLSWCGGLSEARKIAAMAEAWHVPVAPHDCTGPVVYAASCHFSLHARNALIQESVRAFYTGWYTELVTELPPITRGEVTVNMKPGLGIELLPDLDRREDATVRTTQGLTQCSCRWTEILIAAGVAAGGGGRHPRLSRAQGRARARAQAHPRGADEARRGAGRQEPVPPQGHAASSRPTATSRTARPTP